MRYMPDKYPKGHPPDREYFFNVLNTLSPDYLKRVIAHANRQRNAVAENDEKRDCIEISDEWWAQLNDIPFVSSKRFH